MRVCACGRTYFRRSRDASSRAPFAVSDNCFFLPCCHALGSHTTSGCASDRNPRRPMILEIRLTICAPHPCRDTTFVPSPSPSRLGIHARLHINYGQVCMTTYYTPECTFHCLRCVGGLTAKTLFKCTPYRPVKNRHRYRLLLRFSINPCVRSLAPIPASSCFWLGEMISHQLAPVPPCAYYFLEKRTCTFATVFCWEALFLPALLSPVIKSNTWVPVSTYETPRASCC